MGVGIEQGVFEEGLKSGLLIGAQRCRTAVLSNVSLCQSSCEMPVFLFIHRL
jgi:hypothetical protein